jgi:nucleoside-diphosphate-sugar epimerase
MRVLVTGASGFIGSHVTRRLLERGHEVGALVRAPERAWRLRGELPLLRMFTGDLAALGEVEAGLSEWRPDLCIHLAWYAEPGSYAQALENLDSLRASLELLQLLGRIGCRRLVAAGTCAEYDPTIGIYPESAPTAPTTLYGASKLALSLVARQLAAQEDFTVAWARIFYLYGPFEDARRAVPRLIRALQRGETFAATAGREVRDYLHVDDVAAAFVALGESSRSGVFNVCSGVPVTVRELMETVAGILGRPGLIQFGAIPDPRGQVACVRGENRRLRSELSWAPRYGLRDGLEQTVSWWAEASQEVAA